LSVSTARGQTDAIDRSSITSQVLVWLDYLRTTQYEVWFHRVKKCQLKLALWVHKKKDSFI